ncbi:MAG: cytochrome D1 domain-containing protein [Acidobacteriota bacterium]
MRPPAAAAAAVLLTGLAVAPVACAQERGDVLVVLNKSDNTASLLDAVSGAPLATIPVGVGPHEVAVLPGGRRAAVSNYGTRERPGRSLTMIDLGKRAASATIPLPEGARPHGLAALSQDRLLVTAEGIGQLLVVDTAAGKLARQIPLGREISHMVVATPDGLYAFVANIGSGSVTVVDLSAGRVAAEIPTGAGAEGIDLRPGRSEVWVANREANTVSVIDAGQLRVAGSIPVQDFPIRVRFTPDGRRALVSCAKSGDVAVLDAETRREIGRIGIDRESVPGSESRLFSTRFGKSPVPVGLLIAPDGRTAWVASTNADVISVLDLERLAVRGRWTAGKEPDGLAGAFRALSAAVR